MKRLDLILLLAAAALIILSRGYTPGITDKSIVHAVGIDKAEGGYSVTLQLFKPEAAGSDTPVDISKANFKNITADGRDVGQCLSELSQKAGGELFLGHLQLIVIGEDVSFSSPEEIFAPFREDKSIYPGVYLAAAKNAGEIVSFPIKENAVTAENYRRILDNAASGGGALLSRLVDIDNRLYELGAAAMPFLELSGEKEQRCLTVRGSRILGQGGFFEGEVSREEGAALSLLRSTPEAAFPERRVFLNGSELTVSKSTATVSFPQSKGQQRCRVTLKLKAKDTPGGSEEALEQVLTTALDKYLMQKHADLTDLSAQLRLWHPKLYAKYKNRLYELWESTELDVSVSFYS